MEVLKMGNPELRKRCEPVNIKSIRTPDFQQTLDDLITTMRKESGAGIAASQVGIMKRFFAMELKNNSRYPDREPFALRIAINPQITPIGTEMQGSWEGCLSIPNIRGRLKRHQHIQLTALDQSGEKYVVELSGFESVVAQHELDHLNGVLFIDRMESMETLTFQDEFEKFWL